MNNINENINETNVCYCRYCRSRDIVPVKIVSRHGPKVKTMYSCPVCGEYLDVRWGKKGY